jgi:hypothetical protein
MGERLGPSRTATAPRDRELGAVRRRRNHCRPCRKGAAATSRSSTANAR